VKIAVITPSKPNRTALLEECKASVTAQTRAADIHVVKVDYEGIGPAVLRNQMVMDLSPEYNWLAFLDDDDVFLPRHLELLSIVSGDADVVYSPSQLDLGYQPFDREVLKERNFVSVTSLVRRSIFAAVGGFRDLVKYEDWHLWEDISDAGGRFIFIPEVTWLYRIRPEDTRNWGAELPRTGEIL